MKKFLATLFSISVVTSLVSFPSVAVDINGVISKDTSSYKIAGNTWEKKVWKQHGLYFYTPPNSTILTNTADTFVGEDSTGFHFTIGNWKNEQATAQSIADSQYAQLGKDKGSDSVRQSGAWTTRGLNGYYYSGQANDNGSLYYFSVAGYIDPESSHNCYVSATYWANRNTKENHKKAAELMKSIGKIVY